MTAAAFGVSSLVAISANFVVWIKWLGVIYLLWLGLKLILRRDPLDIVQAVL
jgi:threonine/homoserine/homoserine lactone efflux protein